MIYEYKCPTCKQILQTARHRGDRLNIECPYCGSHDPARRVFSFAMQRPMQEHWNKSVNKPIRDMKQYKRELARKSDEASEYAGIEHRFEPIDPEDTKALGVTAEGLDYTNRARVAQGLKPINIDAL